MQRAQPHRDDHGEREGLPEPGGSIKLGEYCVEDGTCQGCGSIPGAAVDNPYGASGEQVDEQAAAYAGRDTDEDCRNVGQIVEQGLFCASFLRGFEFALLLAGVILAAAGVVGWRGLRHVKMPQASQPV
jgi:hypothetical protein